MHQQSIPTITDFMSSTIQQVYVSLEMEKLKACCPLTQQSNKILKRTFDILFSVMVMLFLLSWLLPLLALYIKLTSGGDVFFKQQRTGLHNHTFTVWKLRTMRPNSEAHVLQAKQNDTRITKAGKFLRKYSLDELPQFFNVFVGDMSIVGPRPHMLKHTEEYAAKHQLYNLRHTVKPGITGLSQVLGYRGEIQCPFSLRNRITLDIFYIKKWSLGLDIYIIAKTVKLLLIGDKNAY